MTKHRSNPSSTYNTGRLHPGGNQPYWKTLPSVIHDYIQHPEKKFKNGKQTGKMTRKHLYIDADHNAYIGKEASEIEENEVLGVSEASYVSYS